MERIVIDSMTGQERRFTLTPAEVAALEQEWEENRVASIVYADRITIQDRVRTTTATPTELYRATLRPLTGYAAELRLIGVDAGNGAVRTILASVVVKRLQGNAILVGPPVVIANHADTGTTTWAISASVSGPDFVISVTGETGRTIDWLLDGTVRSFTPAGIDA